MLCQNCGTELENGVCQKCQTSNENPSSTPTTVSSESCSTPVSPNSDYKTKIISFIITIVLIFGVCLGIYFFLFGGSSEEEQNPTFALNMTSAEIAIKDYVSYPSTLKFSYYEDEWNIITNDNKRVKMESSFECQNAFGVSETHDFILIITYTDDYSDFTINDLYIDNEEYV